MAKYDKMGVLITGFILLLVGAILIQTIANSVYSARNLDTVSNDTTTLVNNTCVEITSGCIGSITEITNATDSGAAVLSSSEYSVCRSGGGFTDRDGVLAVLDTPAYLGTANVTYTNSPDCTYVDSSTSRTLLNIVTIFFALALLALGVGIFQKMREGAF